MSHEQRDAFGYTESQYEAADKMLDREKDDRLERDWERDKRLASFGARVLEEYKRRLYLDKSPCCGENVCAQHWGMTEATVHSARSLGLLPSPSLSPAALDRMLGDIERAPDEKS